MTSTIKAIETSYKGYRFRSRLEARWAVAFDSLGWKWEYEVEGFDLGKDAGWYLPDFRLTKEKVWVEIKATSALSTDEKTKVAELCRQSEELVAVVFGQPWVTTLCMFLEKPRFSDVCETPGCNCAASLRIARGHLVRCPCCGGFATLCLPGKQESKKQLQYEQQKGPLLSDKELLRAYSAARSARFEHGEGRPR